MADPPIQPPPLVPNYQPPPPTTGQPFLAFFGAFLFYFPVLLGMFLVVHVFGLGDWAPPILAFVLVSGPAIAVRSPAGFLGALVAFVVGLLGCGFCTTFIAAG